MSHIYPQYIESIPQLVHSVSKRKYTFVSAEIASEYLLGHYSEEMPTLRFQSTGVPGVFVAVALAGADILKGG